MVRLSLVVGLLLVASCSRDHAETTAADAGDGDGDDGCPAPRPASMATCSNGTSEAGELCLQFSATYVPVEPGVGFGVTALLATGDLDDDGNLDVVADWRTMLGDGNGGFVEFFGWGGDGITTADFGGGPATDLVWFDSYDWDGWSSRVLLKFGGPDFAVAVPQLAVALEWEAEQLAAGDFDGDGVMDLAIVQRDGTDVVVHELIWARGLGDGQFELFENADVVLYNGDVPNHITAGQLTTDGRDDLLWRPSSAAVFLLGAANGPELVQDVPTEIATVMLSDAIIDKDINCDDIPDIVAARTTGGFAAWTQAQAGFPTLVLAHDTGGWSGDPAVPMALEDLNNDQRPDLLLLTPNDTFIAIAEDSGKFSEPSRVDTPHPWIVARVADLDGNGLPDLIGLYDDIYDPNLGEVIENAGVDVLLANP